jgi:hypothetical protein
MPGGRPTLYDPAYCEEARTFLKDGYSTAALAGKLGVAVSTVSLWIETHPEFSEAVKVGRAGAVHWWEERARHLAMTGEGNATAVVFGLKNRAAAEWKDMSYSKHGGENGEAIKLEVSWASNG